MDKIAVLGAGSWGTALAMVLNDNGHEVRLWTHLEEHANEINETHRNEALLKDVVLSDKNKAYVDLKKAIEDVSTILFVLPTEVIRLVAKQLKEELTHNDTIAQDTKGLEPETYKRI